MRAVAAYSKRHEMVLTNNNKQEELNHRINKSTLKDLNVHCNLLVKKLKRARRTLADQQLKLKAIETAKGKTECSVETKKFKLLKNVGIELSSYHGGSLNGKDIKKVINNSAHIFDELAVIMKEGKRPNSILSNANVDALCLHFWEVFVLWEEAFLLAQTVGPMEQDTTTYLRYVLAAVHGNDALGCTVTPKVHMMLKHIAFQIRYIQGGLGDKIEDWVERTASDRDASATALLHGPEPGHPSIGAGEGEFPFVASQCDCSHKCDECREQAFLFCREG